MLVEPLGCSSSRWDVVQLSGCLYSLRGHEARDPCPVCHQSLLLSSHAGATSLLHSFLRHSFFFPRVRGFDPRSLFTTRFSSGPVRLSSGKPAAPAFPPLLLPFRFLLSFCLSVAVSPSLHFIRSVPSSTLAISLSPLIPSLCHRQPFHSLSLSFSFPCFLKETANEQESVLRRSGPHPGPGRSRKHRHRTDPNQPPARKEKTAVWKKKKRKEERRKDGNSTGQCHNEGTSLCSLTSFFFSVEACHPLGSGLWANYPTTI